MNVTSVDDLVTAAGDPAVSEIRIHGRIAGAPPISLAAGQRLAAATAGAAIAFAPGGDGVRLSRDNELSGVRLEVEPSRRAVHNDTAVDDLGTLRLTGLATVGRVHLVAADRVRRGHIAVDGLHIVAADTRSVADRPALLGVGALLGGFTLWSQHPEARLTADLRTLSGGQPGAPIRGSGVLVAGTADGSLNVEALTTGAIHTDGGIPEGTHDTISGGVFVVFGARVARVENLGPVTTYGVNDMILDNWGHVDRWTAHAPLTSYGRSGVGFVNFGAIGTLRVAAPIETYGIGGRGFNVYRLDGFTGPTVERVEFDRIVTHADASIGVQIGQPIGTLIVHNGIRTFGGAGESLVRGEIVRLAAHALSVQPGGRVERLDVHGGLATAGDHLSTLDVRGEVVEASISGGIVATGTGSEPIHVDGGVLGLVP